MVRFFWGKLIGGLLGFALFRFWGALIGAYIGHRFDVNVAQYSFFMGGPKLNELKAHFFEALFSCMGYVAKADGRVTESEIQVARAIMQSLQLSPQKTKEAIAYFQAGKDAQFDMRALLHALREECRRNRSLLRMFMQLQFQAAYADSGSLHPLVEKELVKISQYLGFSTIEYQQIHAMFQAQYEFARQHFQGGGRRSGHSTQGPKPRHSEIENAYHILGVNSKATQEQVKKAYRRLMNEYHPDKLAAKGLPNEMMKAATEKTTQIQLAYEEIKQYKGWS
jgi:DnaJ like chaperone protein